MWRAMFSSLRFRYTMLPKEHNSAETALPDEDERTSASHSRELLANDQVSFEPKSWWYRDR